MTPRSAPRVPYARLVDLGGDVLLLQSAYSPELNAALKTHVPPAGRRWDVAARGWRLGTQYGRIVADLCAAYLGVAPTIPTARVGAATPPRETRLFEVRYLGKAKDRAGGEWASSGWVRAPQPGRPATDRGRGDWELSITLQALRRFFEPSYRLRDPGDDEAPAGTAPAATAPPTFYDILGVAPDADEAALKRGYRQMALQWHPDRCREPDAHTTFIRVQEAWETLRDPGVRRRYDQGLRVQAQAAQTAGGIPTAPVTPLAAVGVGPFGWSPPRRAGYFLVVGRAGVRGFRATHILDIRDVVDERGCILVSSWPKDADDFEELWVAP